MAEHHDIRLFLLSPIQGPAIVIAPYIAMAMGHGNRKTILLHQKFCRSPVLIQITVPTDRMHGNPCFRLDKGSILAVVPGMKPKIHRSCCCQDLFQSLQIPMGVTDNTDLHFIFLHWLISLRIAFALWLIPFFSSMVASPRGLCSSVDQNSGS